MTATLADIDRALTEWTTRLARIDDNLLALETGTTLSVLEEAGERGLDGATRDAIVPVLAMVRELFGDRTLLDAVVTRARERRAALGRKPTAAELREMNELLRGPSVTLLPVETPTAERGLVDAESTSATVTPDELLEQMTGAFATVRDAVARVDEAWTALPAEVDALERAVAGWAVVSPHLQQIRRVLARDPLGTAVRFPTFREICDLHARATRADAMLRAQMAGSAPVAPLVDDGRVGRLAETFGAEGWPGEAEAVRDDERAAVTAREAPVAERDELRGRLAARREQARALAARGRPIDPGLEELGEEAAAVLGAVPTDLARANVLVAAFEARFAASR